jgi:hypothetical protein
MQIQKKTKKLEGLSPLRYTMVVFYCGIIIIWPGKIRCGFARLLYSARTLQSTPYALPILDNQSPDLTV